MKIFCLFGSILLIALSFQDTKGQWRGSKYGKGKRGECNWGIIGKCGGRANTKCPQGSFCKYVNSARNGVCCRIKNNACPSGVLGISCSKKNPCKPGYTCRKRVCCRDPVCPQGWIEGDSCNTLPGQEKCSEGYECINNFCCRSTFCPSGSVGPKCSKRKPCKPGYSCRGGNCCREPVCPPGWQEGGVCNLTPGEPFCKRGFDCNNDFCCRNPIPTRCAGETGPPCSTSAQCEFDDECLTGFCCRTNVLYKK